MGCFFRGTAGRRVWRGTPDGNRQSRDGGTMCLDLACWSASLRANDPFFFSQANTTATRRRTRHRNCPSPHHLHSRDCSSCRERWSRLGLPSSPSLVNSSRLLGALGGKRGKQLRLSNERRVSHNSARICRRVAPLAGQSLGATRSCHGTQEAGPGPSSFAGESRSVDVDVASECALQSPQERDGCPGQSSHRAILPSRPFKTTRQRMPQIHSNGQPSRQ